MISYLMLMYMLIFLGFQIGAYVAQRTSITFTQFLMICLFIKVLGS